MMYMYTNKKFGSTYQSFVIWPSSQEKFCPYTWINLAWEGFLKGKENCKNIKI